MGSRPMSSSVSQMSAPGDKSCALGLVLDDLNRFFSARSPTVTTYGSMVAKEWPMLDHQALGALGLHKLGDGSG